MVDINKLDKYLDNYIRDLLWNNSSAVKGKSGDLLKQANKVYGKIVAKEIAMKDNARKVANDIGNALRQAQSTGNKSFANTSGYKQMIKDTVPKVTNNQNLDKYINKIGDILNQVEQGGNKTLIYKSGSGIPNTLDDLVKDTKSMVQTMKNNGVVGSNKSLLLNNIIKEIPNGMALGLALSGLSFRDLTPSKTIPQKIGNKIGRGIADTIRSAKEQSNTAVNVQDEDVQDTGTNNDLNNSITPEQEQLAMRILGNNSGSNYIQQQPKVIYDGLNNKSVEQQLQPQVFQQAQPQSNIYPEMLNAYLNRSLEAQAPRQATVEELLDNYNKIRQQDYRRRQMALGQQMFFNEPGFTDLAKEYSSEQAYKNQLGYQELLQQLRQAQIDKQANVLSDADIYNQLGIPVSAALSTKDAKSAITTQKQLENALAKLDIRKQIEDAKMEAKKEIVANQLGYNYSKLNQQRDLANQNFALKKYLGQISGTNNYMLFGDELTPEQTKVQLSRLGLPY